MIYKRLLKWTAAAAVLTAVVAFVVIKFMTPSAYPIKYIDYIETYAGEYGLPVPLVCAVIHTESGFDPNAESYIGARGLMQITNDTFEWVKWRLDDEKAEYDDMFDPETNIRYGCYLLGWLKDELEVDETALAAYNAGIGNVRSWLSDAQYSSDGRVLAEIPFEETARYVPKVLRAETIYRNLYDME